MAQKKRLSDKTDKRARGRVRIGTDSDGKPIYRWVSGKTRREMEKRAEALKAEVEAREHDEEGLLDATFEEYAWRWLEIHSSIYKDGTVRRYTSLLKAHILPVIGAKPLRRVVKSDCQNVVSKLSELAYNVSEAVSALMSRIFASAMDDGLIIRNPATQLALSGKSAKERRALTDEERALLVKIIHSEDTQAHLLAALLYYLGLRAGEALGLRWDDIDFGRGVVHVRRSIDAGTNRPIPPKTKAGTRDIPMPSALSEMLRRMHGIGPLFPGEDGDTIWYRNANEYLWKRGVLAELVEAGKRTGVNVALPLTMHYLRHTYASLLYRSGVDVIQAKIWLGHDHISTTMDVYTHISSSQERENKSKIDGVFARLP